MAAEYGHLVKKLDFKKDMGGTPARYKVYMEGYELDGISVNFVIGVYEHTGLWAPKRGYKDTQDRAVEPKPLAHAHFFDEILLFFGYGADGLSNLGAELELSLGEEWEKHKITEPSVVACPKELPHCPLYTTKLTKPFAHMHIALNYEHSGKGVPTRVVEQQGETDGKKYTDLVKKMPLDKKPEGALQGFRLTGEDLTNIPLHLSMGLYDQQGQWHPEKRAKVHPYDKLLIFFGNNADDPNTLGAEITVEIGDEHEKHTFSEATVIVIPKGTPYLPLVCNKIEQPYYAVQVGFAPKEVSEWIDL